ncbi:MAG: LysM peptidoglycan-binding domain-containing protein [candidate division Zixibacteria bacterium]|nr:LysM peptidoglycan-binding domain-containing protein [candidate division Zixibacteria bacterium]
MAKLLILFCLVFALGCAGSRSASKRRAGKPAASAPQSSAKETTTSAGGLQAAETPVESKEKSSNVENGNGSEENDEEEYAAQLLEVEDLLGEGVTANRQGHWDLAQKHFETALKQLSEMGIEEEEFPELHTRMNKLLAEIADELKITLEAQGSLGTEASITSFLDRFRHLKNFEVLKSQLLPQALTRPDPAIQFDVQIPFNERVADALAYLQTVAKKPFAQYLSRSSRYIPLMRQILKKQGVPQDLVFLPLIESGFNPHAYSYAHAVGPWQFIASTGRLYDLDVNYFVDERRDFVKSTYAAANFLSDLYAQYNSWELALAAYNGGPGRISRAMKRQDTKDFWEMKLRQQTENYVPLFAAAVMIAKEPKKYGFGDVIYEPAIEFDTVVVLKPLELSVVARFVDCTVPELKELNPHLARGVTPPGKFTLRVPSGKEGVFWAHYEQMPQARKMVLVRHKIRRGESLAAIAQRYGTTAGDLIRINRLRKAYRPKAGRTLLVPAYVSSDYLAERKAARGTYRVRRGDTLGKLARRFGVSIAALKQANNLDSDILPRGKRLVIPGHKPTAVASASPAKTSGRPATYRVRRGDSLWEIAKRFGVTVRDLKAFNNLSSHILAVGTVIRIP